jgi:hypothetical protein
MGHLLMRKKYKCLLQTVFFQAGLPIAAYQCVNPACMDLGTEELGEQYQMLATLHRNASVDQLESPVPGLIGQLKGTPTLV